MGGSAGGHKEAARAEIPVEMIEQETKGGDMEKYLMQALRTAL